MVHRLLTVVASVVAEQRPWSGQAPEVVVGRLSCPVACGIFFLTRDWAHVPCIGRQILTYQGSPKCFCIASIQKPECGTQFFANKALERWSTCSNAIWEAEEGREPPHLRQMQAGSPFPNQKEIKGCVGCRRSPQKLRPTLLENYLVPRNWKEYSLLHFKDVFHDNLIGEVHQIWRSCAIIITYMCREVTSQSKGQQHQSQEISKSKHTGMSITNQYQQVFTWKVNFFNK